MNITLYYAPFACSLVPYVALTEAKADFTVQPINIRGKEQMSADYLALNAKHKVPLLLVDGKPLSENVAIQLWIAREFPDAEILPSQPWMEAQAVSLLSWFSSGFHPNISRMNAPLKFCDVPGSEDSVKALAQKSLFEAFALADQLLEGRQFFFEHFTSADAYLFWCWRRTGMFGLDLSQFKNCAAHFERLNERASIQKVLAYDQEIQARFGL